MVVAFFCLVGVFAILLLAEKLRRMKVLKGEDLRKFVHISVGSFVAFWPWIIGWGAIELISLAMLAVVVVNWRYHFFSFSKKVGRRVWGDAFLALGFFLTAWLADFKIFFTIAILQVALADGIAAVVGKRYGKQWEYKVLGQTKSVIGSMAFWFVSFCILSIALPFGAHNIVNYQDYALLLVFLPPLLTGVENISIYGLDNLTIPLVTLFMLHLTQIS